MLVGSGREVGCVQHKQPRGDSDSLMAWCYEVEGMRQRESSKGSRVAAIVESSHHHVHQHGIKSTNQPTNKRCATQASEQQESRRSLPFHAFSACIDIPYPRGHLVLM